MISIRTGAAVVLALVTFQFGITKSAQHRFDYHKDAQKLWHEHSEKCAGKYQSPINIVSHRTVSLPLPALERIYYHDLLPSCLRNTGHSVSLIPQSSLSVPRPRIFGAVLKGEYVMEGLHFHWGHRNSRGSEHVLSGIRFPLEMHIIHRNMMYPNVSEAIKYKDGLSVLAFFFQARERSNDNLHDILRLFHKLKKPLNEACLERSIALSSLLENNMDVYYAYQGSLTTPPCSEAVTWILFPDPLYISYNQIKKFRRLHSEEESPLLHNFRLPQPLNARIVYKRDLWKNNLTGNNRTDVDSLSWYKLLQN